VLLMTLIATGFVYEQISRRRVAREFPRQGAMVNVGDHQLNYRALGEGTPLVVFESGLDTGGFLPWTEVQTQVATFTATFAYARAGLMWSERGGDSKTCEHIASDLFESLKQTNHPGPYLLVGHSMAGLCLRVFVNQHASQVMGVVFVEATNPALFARIPSAALDGPPSWIVNFLSSTGAIRFFGLADTTQASEAINTLWTAYEPVSLRASLEEDDNLRSLAEEASAVNSFGNIPLTVITATARKGPAEIETLWVEMQTDLLRLSSNSRQVFATKSDHYVQFDEPAIVVEAIKAMIETWNLRAQPERH
jgi:pimeloyl-ACP methyl ester carboxylesterase